MMVLAALLALAVGLVLGMLGAGGAILTLPMLVYAVGLEPRSAIATSLFVVGSTSLVGTVVNARARTVEWRTGLVFGAAAMAGAFTGGRLSSFVPAPVLLTVFAVVMLVTATAMLKGRAEPLPSAKRPAIGRVVPLGAGVGILSGLVGAGGGFLIVPALAIFGRMPMAKAVATSLFVIALQAFAGFAGHVAHATLAWSVIAVVTSASVVGMLVGIHAGRKISAGTLRRGFAWLVIAMGLFVIGKQASPLVTALVAAVTVAAGLVVTRARPALAK
jgi:uncharacterized membrane protein YfcA